MKAPFIYFIFLSLNVFMWSTEIGTMIFNRMFEHKKQRDNTETFCSY